MTLALACKQILDQLITLITQIDETDYVKPSAALSQSTIGQHLRHTLEFFLCFERGFYEGVVNYDRRAHDKQIETDKNIALGVLCRISSFVGSIATDKPILLEVGYDCDREEFMSIESNVFRELVYNIEHAVHHMAIMKIGIREVAPYIDLPAEFGVAASTLRWKEVKSTSCQ